MSNETVEVRELPEIPLHDFLGIPMDTSESLSADGDSFRIEVPLTDKMRGAAMPVHGGVLSALMDIACGNVASGPELWNRGAIPVTTDLHIRYYRQPSKGPLVVEAHARRKGRR